VSPGASLHDEIAEFIASGIAAEEVFRIATRDAARFLGRGDDLGTVRPGMLADLVILRANPLEEPETARTPWAVMAGGQWVVGPGPPRERPAKAAPAPGGRS
jgi:imidazolonepropionase-like amidohydrolase